MIQCEVCRAQNLTGVLFCTSCGQPLWSAAGSDLIVEAQPKLTAKVILVIGKKRRRQELELLEPAWIGRSDPETDFWPSVDLTDDAGLEHGVSRRHALLTPTGSGLQIADKHSANGTWVENTRLSPDVPLTLPEKAKVRLGNLTIELLSQSST